MEQHSHPINIVKIAGSAMNSVVMRGVKIGRGCVVGARVIKEQLNIAPPPRVEWDVPEHGPYFYSGFEATNAERPMNKCGMA